jgi:glycosyltransferase involved in cell wall biosynthesis
MRIILATGIYPPEIGGPATYVRALAKELVSKGCAVTVITYGSPEPGDGFDVHGVSRSLPILRWFSYARVLKKYGRDADAVIAFSSVSAGVPVWLARLKKPKKFLRLGGDFFWERYTDRGGMKGLRAWYESKTNTQQSANWIMNKILHVFDSIVFSTEFQKKLYEEHYWEIPSPVVLENALPCHASSFDSAPHSRGSAQDDMLSMTHKKHKPFRLLFMGRFVGFKNLPALIKAAASLNDVLLMFVGDGPVKKSLPSSDNVTFVASLHGEEKQRMFADHDLLVIPSITEISPNVALEARASGMPVLLTKETGLSDALTKGMIVRDLSTPEKIKTAVEEVRAGYDGFASQATDSPHQRGWREVADEWLELLSN